MGALSSDHSALCRRRPNKQQQSSTAAAACQPQQSIVAAAPREDLQKSRNSDPYRRRMRGAVIAFLMFGKMEGVSTLELVHDINALDATLINAKNRNFFGRLRVSLVRDDMIVSCRFGSLMGSPPMQSSGSTASLRCQKVL